MLFKKKNQQKKEKILSYEKPMDSKKSLLFLWNLLDKKKGLVIVTIVSNVVSSILVALIPWATAQAIDKVLNVMNASVITEKWATIQIVLRGPIIWLIAIGVFSFLLNYFQEYQMARIGEEASLTLREKLTDKLTKLPLKFYDDTQVGELLSKATSDIDKISEVIITGFNQFIYSLVSIVLGIGILFYINVPLTIIVMLILLVGVVATAIVSTQNQKLFHKNMTTLSSLSNLVEETLSGNLVVKSYNKENNFIQLINDSCDEQYTASKNSQFLNFAIYPAIRFINQIAFIVAAFFSARLVIQGVLTVGIMQAFLQYVMQISEPISNASYIINSLQGALVSTERIQQILELEEDKEYTNNPVTINNPEGAIEFQHVSFGYSPSTTLMNDVSFLAKPQQMIAVVGPTGAGKTTLVNLLMRFYDINYGKILLDGIDTKEMTRNELRRHFGMVLQDTWLFKGTVADNIAYGKEDANREEIINAAKIAQCDSFIRKLPQGYDTVISSEDGIVSQGEQQLLTIARAILVDPTIMILDEATSSIDTKTEKDIQTAIAKVMQGRTSFVIAHRLSTIKNADLILVMKHGDIIESGTHDELLTKQSHYAKLYETQFS